jgi:hypothetical protein
VYFLGVGVQFLTVDRGPKGMECGTNYMWEYNLGETMIRSEAGPYGGPTCLKAAGRSNST